jgi:hypothetical protein
MIHHSVTSATTTMADLDRMHRTRGFTEIGYHYGLQRDTSGRVHLKKGRAATKPGAHCHGGWNRKALGLVVIGTFHPGLPHSEHPDEGLITAIVDACAHLCQKHAIAPSAILGHRDQWATACPGDYLYAHLPEIRQRVADALTGD